MADLNRSDWLSNLWDYIRHIEGRVHKLEQVVLDDQPLKADFQPFVLPPDLDDDD